MTDSTLAVIVIYNEMIDASDSLNSLDRAFTSNLKMDVLVYDNSKAPQSIENNKFTKFNFIYYHNPENAGIGAAYNMGGEIAIKRSKKWLLLLDQDTNFATDYFVKMNEASLQNPDIKLFAPILKLSTDTILSPCNFKFYHGSHLKHISPGINALSNNQPINSGIIVRLDAFLKAGGYNEKVKLDYSDHQFIERFKKTEKVYYVINSVGEQNFSGLENDLEKILTRFKYYCNGALHFETNAVYNKYVLHFFLYLKLIKNSVKHKTLGFFKVYFSALSNSLKG